jgi:hypothetical protein
MAAGFSTVCTQAIGNAYSTTGTLTRGSLKALSSSAIAALFSTGGKWHEMKDLLKHQIEMRASGIRRNSLYDWIMSSNKEGLSALLTKRSVLKGGSQIQPFILAMQRSVVNDDHWYVSANQTKAAYDATPSPTLTGIDAGSRVLGVKSVFGSTLELHASYFLPGKFLYQLSLASTTATLTQWKVVQAGVNSQDSTVMDVEVVKTQKTSSEIDSTATLATGLLFPGVNNVNDVEAWCRNMINTNNKKKVPFWFQTVRHARRVDRTYRELFAKLMQDNDYFAQFQDIPLVERNRQDEVRRQKEMVNAMFFNTAVNANQTLSGWDSLDTISSVTNTYGNSGEGAWANGEVVGYRANFIGIVPQLHACSRVNDSAGASIDIKTWVESSLYEVYRARESAGRPIDVIDVGMSNNLKLNFQKEYIKYSKDITGDIVRLSLDGQNSGTTEFGFPFQVYQLYKPGNLKLAIYTDPFYDDLESAAATASVDDVGNMAMILDIGQGGSIYPAVLASKRVLHKTGELADLAKIDATYACRMDNPTTETTLTSETLTMIVEDPMSSRIDRNFSEFQYNAP